MRDLDFLPTILLANVYFDKTKGAATCRQAEIQPGFETTWTLHNPRWKQEYFNPSWNQKHHLQYVYTSWYINEKDCYKKLWDSKNEATEKYWKK